MKLYYPYQTINMLLLLFNEDTVIRYENRITTESILIHRTKIPSWSKGYFQNQMWYCYNYSGWLKFQSYAEIWFNKTYDNNASPQCLYETLNKSLWPNIGVPCITPRLFVSHLVTSSPQYYGLLALWSVYSYDAIRLHGTLCLIPTWKSLTQMFKAMLH